MRLYRQPAVPTDKVPQHLAEKYKNEAGRYWEAFYQRNADKFFKDRHYFDKEFPELLDGQLTVLEVGCGVGNSVFPLLGINPHLRVYACDFSATAVQIVQAHPDYSKGRVTAFVADITQDQLLQHVPGRTVDYCSMVFVLSAVAPEKMPQAIRNVASVLKPGTGRVVFRDYAEGDLAQTRLEGVNGSRFIRENFYVRGDGTCCYYYTEAGLKALFASEGFKCESHLIHARVIENRKSGVKMNRRWVQAVFRYAPEEIHCQELQLAERQWEAAQQQQQSKEPLLDIQPQQQQQWGSGSSSVTVKCAGCEWKVPELLSSSSSSSSDTCEGDSSSSSSSSGGGACSCLHLVAFELDKLLQQQQQQQQQQQLTWLGLLALLLPPWLMLATPEQQQQQYQGQCLQLYEAAKPPRIAMLNGLKPNSSSSGDNSPAEQQQYRQYTQGAVAALIALVAVRLGAKRVYAVMPGKDNITGDAGPYETGFNAVLQLNECDVVIERVRQRRWAEADKRQLQLLQHELQEQQKFTSIHVVIGQTAAVAVAEAGTTVSAAVQHASEGSCTIYDLQTDGVGLQDEVYGLLSRIWRGSTHHQQKQLLLLLQDS